MTFTLHGPRFPSAHFFALSPGRGRAVADDEFDGQGGLDRHAPGILGIQQAQQRFGGDLAGAVLLDAHGRQARADEVEHRHVVETDDGHVPRAFDAARKQRLDRAEGKAIVGTEHGGEGRAVLLVEALGGDDEVLVDAEALVRRGGAEGGKAELPRRKILRAGDMGDTPVAEPAQVPPFSSLTTEGMAESSTFRLSVTTGRPSSAARAMDGSERNTAAWMMPSTPAVAQNVEQGTSRSLSLLTMVEGYARRQEYL